MRTTGRIRGCFSMLKMRRAARAKKIAWALIVAIVISCVPAPAANHLAYADAVFAGGSGIDGDPFQIHTAEQLNNVRNNLNSHFILLNDIDLTGYLSEAGAGWNDGAGWAPIGTSGSRFAGVFDGAEYRITGLHINRPTSENVGLFGSTNGARIQNVEVWGVSIKGGSYVGGLIGRGYETTVSQCGTSGTVTGTGDLYTGGLIGYMYNGSVSRCNRKEQLYCRIA